MQQVQRNVEKQQEHTGSAEDHKSVPQEQFAELVQQRALSMQQVLQRNLLCSLPLKLLALDVLQLRLQDD